MPARTDWTAASTVSGELTEVAHEFNVPLLSAVQMNAQGEVAGSRDVARDADAIFTLKKPGDDFTGVRKLEATKLRRGATGDRWTIRFDPTRGRFEDVTPEEAAAIRAAEERTWS
jgi:predicted ATP-dependent serine protease